MSSIKVRHITSDSTKVSTHWLEMTCQCWLVYDQVGPTTDNSLNVGTVTDEATGQFSFSITNAFENIFYMYQLCNSGNTTESIVGGCDFIHQARSVSGAGGTSWTDNGGVDADAISHFNIIGALA